jgi:hypothetical protein
MTFIEQQPMYTTYCVAYPWGEVPGMPGKPYLCPGTEDERRWPEPGEVVTFTAHLTNKGALASPAATYNWRIDGAVVARVAVDRRGEIIVADTGNSRVVRIADNVLPDNFLYLPLTKR